MAQYRQWDVSELPTWYTVILLHQVNPLHPK
jgi:hypothetical protein